MLSSQDNKFTKIHNLSDLYYQYDAIFFDIWGVLHEGGELYPGVREIFNKISNEKQVRIISNAPRLRETICSNLNYQGLNLISENIFTSGEITRFLIKNSKSSLGIESPIIYHIGGDRNTEILLNMDVKITDKLESANLILISAFRDMGEDFADITNIFHQAKLLAIPLLCANPDTQVLHQDYVRKCSGYFANIYKEMGGKVYFAGKPEKLIFDQAIESTMKFLNSDSLRDRNSYKFLMIGDNFSTDIEGANNSSIDSGLVITGNMGLLLRSQNLEANIENINKIVDSNPHKPTMIISMR